MSSNEFFPGHNSPSSCEGFSSFQLLAYQEIPCAVASEFLYIGQSYIIFPNAILIFPVFNVHKRCHFRQDRVANANVRSLKMTLVL